MKNACVILLLLLCGCKDRPKSNPEVLPQIPVITVKPSNIVFNNKIVADIQAIKKVEIRSRIRGFLENIFVDEGMPVRKGQPLFKLSSPEYTAEALKAEATLTRAAAEEKSANLEVERVQLLVKKNVVTQSELILAESKVEIARAAVLEAKANLNNAKAFLAYTTISAPFDGIIDRIPLKMGSLVNEGDLLTTISDITSIYAYFYLPEKEYLQYLLAKQKGDSLPDEKNVHLVLADGSMYKYRGMIETVAGQIDGTTGAIAFRAKFPNPEKLLKHGASGTIKLDTDVDGVIVIPQKSVMAIQDKNYVFSVDSSRMVKMKSIEVGNRIGLNYLVKSGLTKDEKIVLEGVQLLHEGDKINAIEKNFN
jgi:membrane fusion protein (multidrug efflux system)